MGVRGQRSDNEQYVKNVRIGFSAASTASFTGMNLARNLDLIRKYLRMKSDHFLIIPFLTLFSSTALTFFTAVLHFLITSTLLVASTTMVVDLLLYPWMLIIGSTSAGGLFLLLSVAVALISTCGSCCRRSRSYNLKHKLGKSAKQRRSLPVAGGAKSADVAAATVQLQKSGQQKPTVTTSTTTTTREQQQQQLQMPLTAMSLQTRSTAPFTAPTTISIRPPRRRSSEPSSRRKWQHDLMLGKPPLPRRSVRPGVSTASSSGVRMPRAETNTGRELDPTTTAQLPTPLLKQTYATYKPLQGEVQVHRKMLNCPQSVIGRNFPPLGPTGRSGLRHRKHEVLKEYKQLAKEAKRRGHRPEFGTPSGQSSTAYESSVEDLA